MNRYYFNGTEFPALPDPFRGVSPMTDDLFRQMGGVIEDDGQPTPKEKFFIGLNTYMEELEAEAERLALDISVDEFKHAAATMMSSDLIAWAKGKGVPNAMIELVRGRILAFVADASRIGLTWNDIFPKEG